ncbi:MAG: carboxymuconolactone decarboxylase family protein [Pseudonocardiaceae bacterium]
MDLPTAAPDAYTSVRAFDHTVMTAARKAGIEPAILNLVKLRASQLNGCAFCLDMHSREARQEGESEQRIYVLHGWRDAPFFTERERAALALAEAVTFLHEGHVPDETYDMARAVFSEEEVAHLVLAATVINAWNRISIATRLMPIPRRE